MSSRMAVVTGANRGLGAAVAIHLAKQGYAVWGATRTKEGMETLEAMGEELLVAGSAGALRPVLFDVEDENPSLEVMEVLEDCDVLINNAGWGADLPNDTSPGGTSLFALERDTLWRAIEINAESARRLMGWVVPGMVERGYGRIVNVTSARAALGEVTGDILAPAYRLSKLLLNGMTVLAGHELEGTGVLVNALCPGWCKTRMGGPQASEPPEAGAVRIARLAMLPVDGPSGKYFINDQIVPF